MTLPDFLLARIAEDEADVGADGSDPSGYCDAQEGAHYTAARVLAECEAKRRIIRWVTDPTVMCEVTDPILQALAQAYADHPDYREEWRP